MKTLVYIRVSTSTQEASEVMQKEKCLNYCNMMGYDIVDVIVDSNVSGGVSLFDRPSGVKIKEYLDRKKANHIVSWDLTRLFRDVVDGLTVIKYFNTNNITFSIMNLGGNIIDTSTPIGEMVITMFLAIGRLEKETTRDRVKKALNHRKDNLKVYSGKTPYGFRVDGKDLIPVKEEMENVKLIYLMKQRRRSYRDISGAVGLTLSKVHRIANDSMYERFL